MKIVSVNIEKRIYENYVEVWFDNPKEVWTIHEDETLRAAYRFSVTPEGKLKFNFRTTYNPGMSRPAANYLYSGVLPPYAYFTAKKCCFYLEGLDFESS